MSHEPPPPAGRRRTGPTAEAMADPFNLARFLGAQDAEGAYERAVLELRTGRKRSHWMWFIFPQAAGLGHSAMSRRYAIASLEEAVAYVQHPLLGPRLIECAGIVQRARAPSAEEIFGPLDAGKLQSSMTLFMRAAPAEPVFAGVLERYFDGAPDPASDRLL